MNTSAAAILVKEWKSKPEPKKVIQFDIQSHRGARGLMPENTIPACIEAIRNGTTSLHLDVVVSADQELVAVQDAMLRTVIHSHIDGAPLSVKDAAQFNIYKM